MPSRRTPNGSRGFASLPGFDDFWRFSLRLYGRAEAEAACLWLQDRCGADVNLLLFCCWLGQRRRVASPALLGRAAARVAGWRRQVIEPLRRVRRLTRSGPGRRSALAGVPAAWRTPVHAAAQAAELQAERVEQRLLAGLAASASPAAGSDAAANLDRYRMLLGVPAERAVARRLGLLAAAAGAAGGR